MLKLKEILALFSLVAFFHLTVLPSAESSFGGGSPPTKEDGEEKSLSFQDIISGRNRGNCRHQNNCTIGERCIFINDCQGQPYLTCIKNFCEADPHARMHTSKLFVVGSAIDPYKAEVIDLSAENGGTCPTIADYPYSKSPFVIQAESMTLVCGGETTDQPPENSKCYEYHQGGWVYRVSANQYWVSAAVIRLDEDRWLIAGGKSSQKESAIFHIGSHSFSDLDDLPDSRSRGVQLVRFNETHAMILGNRFDGDTSHFFNTLTMEWTGKGPESTAIRRQPQAGFIRFKNGTEVIALVGGRNETSGEYLDIRTLTWSFGPSLPNVVFGGCMAQVDDTFYIVGNRQSKYNHDIYKFNTDTEEWVTLPGKATLKVAFAGCFFVPDDYVNCS